MGSTDAAALSCSNLLIRLGVSDGFEAHSRSTKIYELRVLRSAASCCVPTFVS